jgi:exopolyphosphatase/guanosine-5'-triphosphate,3'-diphosphate pyrophosphatase
MRVGIIDLGTNTFNILIASIEKNKPFEVLLNTKASVMLGQEGLNNGFISDKAFTRAYGVLRDFSQLVSEFKCEKVVAYGTSALREASNSHIFVKKISDDLNIQISTISGHQEAEFIYLGAREAVEFNNENYLILDIGGGSNELIIANKDGIHWKESFKLGGARLLERFKPEDPIAEKTIIDVNHLLEQELKPLSLALEKFPVTQLVGSSGAFDCYAAMVQYNETGNQLSKKPISSVITFEQFNAIYHKIIGSTRTERLLMPGLESIRVDTIIMASIFTKYVLTHSKVKGIIQSAYSLKEGVAAQL